MYSKSPYIIQSYSLLSPLLKTCTNNTQKYVFIQGAVIDFKALSRNA